jgi:hypothetical protein
MNGLPDAIFRKWGHSREEDTGDITVYRPEDFNFPRARGRDGIEFGRDGTFIEWQIGAADAQRGVQGHWQAEGPGRVRVNYEMNARPSQRLEIVECSPEILKVRQRQAGP